MTDFREYLEHPYIFGAVVLALGGALLILSSGCGGPIEQTIGEAGFNIRAEGTLTTGDGAEVNLDIDGWCRWTGADGLTCVDFGPVGFDGEIVVMPYVRAAGVGMLAPSIALGVDALPGSVDWDARGCVMLGPMGWCPLDVGSEPEGSGDAE